MMVQILKNFLKFYNKFIPKVLLSYFNDLSKKYKASTLWSTRGALARVFLLHGIHINGNNYSNVNLFLKQKSRLHKQKSILIAKIPMSYIQIKRS